MAREQRKRITHAQNFLVRPALVRQIIERATLTPDDLVLEIGPGRGMLTRGLAAVCRQVLAIEKDATLAQKLAPEVRGLGNVVLFAGDFLDLPLPLTPYKVVANIPFNITAAIIAKLTESANPPENATLVLQREAADRFVGQPHQTLIALLLRPWFELSIADRLRQADFVQGRRGALAFQQARTTPDHCGGSPRLSRLCHLWLHRLETNHRGRVCDGVVSETPKPDCRTE